MGELESIRSIARRLVAEFRAKKTVPTVQQFCDESCTETMKVAPTNTGFIFLPGSPEYTLDGLDREWLRQMGIEA